MKEKIKMVRTTQIRKRSWLGKRKRTNGFSSGFKRRRIVRRRVTSYTTQAGRANSFFLRKRRFNVRRFRRTIFRDTQYAPHYRSIGSGNGSLSSPTNSAVCNTSFLNALDNGVASFWTVGGGLVAIDTGVTPPLFKGDITLRGGIIGYRMYNDGSYPLFLKLWLVWTKDSWATNSGNYVLSNMPVGWDPTTVPDNGRDFKFLRAWSVLIQPLNMATFEYRLLPTKIDQTRFATDVSRPYWIFSVSDGDPTGQDNARAVVYYNVSLSADAIGTT